jgi:protein-L-isoaspartate(D-aspartate) O-methyltransferase
MFRSAQCVVVPILALAFLVACPAPGSAGPPEGPAAAKGPGGKPSPADDEVTAAGRRRMVAEQLRSRDIVDERVLAAMGKVPRHLFVPEAYAAMAYEDTPLPIGEGQTISQPYIVALMTQEIRPKASDRVLEIGTGSGYQAAVLAELVGEVYTIELIGELGRRAAALLTRLDYANVRCRIGNGYLGWPEAAPFDAILVTAAADSIPPRLVDQLKPGGRLVMPLGAPAGVQDLILLEKMADGTTRTTSITAVRFVPLVNQPPR